MILLILRNGVIKVTWNKDLGMVHKLTCSPKLVHCESQRILLINGEIN